MPATTTNVTIKGPPVTAELQALLKPYGDGKKVLGVVQLSDGLHVRYYGGKRMVFKPVGYDGTVTEVSDGKFAAVSAGN